MITVCSLLFTKFAIFMYGIPNFIIRQNIHMYKYPPYKYSITCFMQSEVIYTIIAGLTKRKTLHGSLNQLSRRAIREFSSIADGGVLTKEK